MVKTPHLLEPVDVLFFQALILVSTPEKVADLRNKLNDVLSDKLSQKDLKLSEYSYNPLFQKAIAMGFERNLRLSTMGITKSHKPSQRSAPKYYLEFFLKYIEKVAPHESNPKKAFQMGKYLMEDILLTNQILNFVGQPCEDLVVLAKQAISSCYLPESKTERSSKYKEASAVPFELSSPNFSTIPMPIPDLSMKIFSDLLPNDDTFGKIEECFAEHWDRYVGERASLVEEMLMKEKMPAFEKGLLSLVGSNGHFVVKYAADLALAKAYNISGYLPFPNFRNPYELYLSNVLHTRMLFNFPQLWQANIVNLRMSVEKSIDASQVFLNVLPLVPSSFLTGNLDFCQRLVHKLRPLETYAYSDYDYWKWELKTEGFPWELLPNTHSGNTEQKDIIDCYTIEACIGLLVNGRAQMPRLEEMALSSMTEFGRQYYNLALLYVQSMQACQAQCPQYSPYFSRADGRSLTLKDLLLFEITIAQAMRYRMLPCLAPRIAYILLLLKYVQDYESVDAQTVAYGYSQIQLLLPSAFKLLS